MRSLLLFLSLLLSAAASALVTPLPGSTPQTAPPLTPFPNQIAVLVTDANGAAVPGANVRFSFGLFPSSLSIDGNLRAWDCLPDLGLNCQTTSDSNGIAILPGFYAEPQPRTGVTVSAELGSTSFGRAEIELSVVGAFDPRPFKSLQDMWWSGAAENGWGMSVVEHGAQLFNVIYAYDAEGKSTWWVMPTGSWSAGYRSSFTGDVYSPRSSPFFAYDASRLVAGAPAGRVTLSFNGTESATLGGTFGASSVQKNIGRMDISPDTPSFHQSVGDMWWGGEPQAGWGVAIIERDGALFSVWLTYDADGKPIWFAMPGGTWVNQNTYAGSLIRTSGSPWVGVPYDASALKVAASGSYSLRFDDARHATLTYSIGGLSGSVALVRQAF